jgi:hypothetical protein
MVRVIIEYPEWMQTLFYIALVLCIIFTLGCYAAFLIARAAQRRPRAVQRRQQADEQARKEAWARITRGWTATK